MEGNLQEAQLQPVLVGDIQEDFFVPTFQRGYRWGPQEVTRLLLGVHHSDGKPYYLQPVVVKERGDEWELIDGQQRLTTLFLIFQYMLRNGLKSQGAGFSLRYEVRPGSGDYLQTLDPEMSTKNIDYFHLFQAYEAIEAWFCSHGNRRQLVADEIYMALFKNVYVIWYQAPPEVDATTLFTRLNVGRIPLTDAELVKAQLLGKR